MIFELIISWRPKVIEVFPKKINEKNVRANIAKLVSAFLMVAEDVAKEQKMNEVTLTEPLTPRSKTREKEFENIK